MGSGVLVVEPFAAICRSLSCRLQEEGFRVYESCQPAAIITTLRRKSIDAALLGLDGLKREGLSLFNLIKSVQPRVEIITINSSDQLQLSIEGMKLGAFDDFITPFDVDAVIRRTGEACNHSRAKAKRGKSILQRYREAMVAAAFAEAGAPDLALEYLRPSRQTAAAAPKKPSRSSPDKT